MCGKLESVSVEVLSPVMSTSTPGDEGETTEEPVVVVLLKFDEYNTGCHELSYHVRSWMRDVIQIFIHGLNQLSTRTWWDSVT